MNKIPLEKINRSGNSFLNKILWPIGLWLCKCKLARRVYLFWDMREINGEYWEVYGWAMGKIVIPFGKPSRNRIWEWSDPKTLALWKSLDYLYRSRRRLVGFRSKL